MKFVKWIFLIITLLILATGCSDDSSFEPLPINDELSLMTAEERKAYAPNKAFEDVYRRSVVEVSKTVKEKPALFLVQNKLGLTPLMVAISLDEADLALIIVNELSIEDLKATDITGRGYMSYAAQYGMIKLIEKISLKYENSLSWGANRFHNIDFRDQQGRHGLFYASDSNVAKTLKSFWMKWKVTWGMSWTFFSGFYSVVDETGQNFLHAAARDNRHDTLKWGMKELCSAPAFEGAEGFLGNIGETIAWGIDRALGWVQIAPILIPDDMVNGQDLAGNTPLHLATAKGNVEAAKILMSCRFTRYRENNNFGRNSLSEMLIHLDKNTSVINNNYKNIFDQLLRQQNLYFLRFNFVEKMVNDQDVNGDSALHHAARLKDKYFYKKLKNIGNPYLETKDGSTADGLNSAYEVVVQ